MFPLVAEAIGKVLPLESLRYIGFAHVEADELGSLNQFLAAAPRAVAVASQTAVMVSVNDLADRPARALADGEVLDLGRQTPSPAARARANSFVPGAPCARSSRQASNPFS